MRIERGSPEYLQLLAAAMQAVGVVSIGSEEIGDIADDAVAYADAVCRRLEWEQSIQEAKQC